MPRKRPDEARDPTRKMTRLEGARHMSAFTSARNMSVRARNMSVFAGARNMSIRARNMSVRARNMSTSPAAERALVLPGIKQIARLWGGIKARRQMAGPRSGDECDAQLGEKAGRCAEDSTASSTAAVLCAMPPSTESACSASQPETRLSDQRPPDGDRERERNSAVRV